MLCRPVSKRRSPSRSAHAYAGRDTQQLRRTMTPSRRTEAARPGDNTGTAAERTGGGDRGSRPGRDRGSSQGRRTGKSLRAEGQPDWFWACEQHPRCMSRLPAQFVCGVRLGRRVRARERPRGVRGGGVVFAAACCVDRMSTLQESSPTFSASAPDPRPSLLLGESALSAAESSVHRRYCVPTYVCTSSDRDIHSAEVASLCPGQPKRGACQRTMPRGLGCLP